MAGPKEPRRAPFPSRFAKAHRAPNPEIDANKGLRQRQKAERGKRDKKKVQRPGTSRPVPKTKGINPPNPVHRSESWTGREKYKPVVTSTYLIITTPAQPRSESSPSTINLRHRVTTLPTYQPTYLPTKPTSLLPRTTTYNSGLGVLLHYRITQPCRAPHFGHYHPTAVRAFTLLESAGFAPEGRVADKLASFWGGGVR